MTTDKSRKPEVRRVAAALGLKYDEAARVVNAAKAGDLDQMLGRPVIPQVLELPKLDPGTYDPLADTLEAFVDVEASGPTVEVATYPLWNLVDDLFDLADGRIAQAGLAALHDKLGMGDGGTFSIHADTNPVHVTMVEAILDVCAAFSGPRLDDQFDAWLAPSHVQGDFWAVLRAAGALYAVTDEQDPDGHRQTAGKLRTRWHRLLASA